MTDWTLFLASVVLFLALGLLVRTSGQVSLCAVTFTAVGAAGMSHFVTDQGLPWPVALVLAGLVAVPIGALLAIPAIRLSGLYLALATFGFAILVSYMFYSESWMFGNTGLGVRIPRPSTSWVSFESDRAYYYLVLAFATITGIGVVCVNRSRLGRLLGALADSPRGLIASGTSVNVLRVLVFCVSAFLAAIAGALSGAAIGIVSGDSYPPLLSLTYFVLVIICVGNAPWYALLAAAGLSLFPSYVTGSEVNQYLQLAFGVFAILYAFAPAGGQGVPHVVRQMLDRAFGSTGRQRTPEVPVHDVPSPARRCQQNTLELSQIAVHYGGVIAVDRLDLTVETGRITGLIGPNGAGKTTTFDACSGFTRLTAGRITLGGRDVSATNASKRAREGLGRTFQRMELFNSVSVRQNVAVGAEAGYAGYNPVRHLVGRRSDKDSVSRATDEALSLCGLQELAERPVSTLSTGQRRLVELARCLAGDFQILLLDEPSSGLDHAESHEFGRLLRRVVDERGVGILLVEHNMTLVMEICDYVHVLDFGQPLFEGSPADVVGSSLVRAAYFGHSNLDHLTSLGQRSDVL